MSFINYTILQSFILFNILTFIFLLKTYNQKYTNFVNYSNFICPFTPCLANSIPIQTWSIIRSVKKFIVDFDQISKTLMGSDKA